MASIIQFYSLPVERPSHRAATGLVLFGLGVVVGSEVRVLTMPLLDSRRVTATRGRRVCLRSRPIQMGSGGTELEAGVICIPPCTPTWTGTGEDVYVILIWRLRGLAVNG